MDSTKSYVIIAEAFRSAEGGWTEITEQTIAVCRIVGFLENHQEALYGNLSRTIPNLGDSNWRIRRTIGFDFFKFK